MKKQILVETIEAIVGVIICTTLAYILFSLFKPEKVISTEINIVGSTPSCVPEQKPITKDDVKLEIVKQALENDVNIYKSLNIANCESRYNHLAKNKHSSAKGVFQIIDKTFKGYCDGDVLNHKDNIKCFMKLYKKYPNWWVCKG